MFVSILDELIKGDLPWQEVFYSTVVFLLVWISYIAIVIVIHITCLVYGVLRIFQLSCYVRLTLELLPFINPYNWPFWIFCTLTDNYLSLFDRLFPNLKFKTDIFEISTLLGLEAINFFLYTCTLILTKAPVLLQDEFFLRRFEFFQAPLGLFL